VILNSWKDGANNEYRDVITHVDFVNHPVDHSQGPFVPAEQPILCGIRMGLSAPATLEVRRMAEQDGSGNSVSTQYHWITTPAGDKVLAPPNNGKKARGSTARKGRKGKKSRMSLAIGFYRMGDDDDEEDPKPKPPKDDPKDGPEDESDEGNSAAEADSTDNGADVEGYDSLDEILDLLENHFNIAVPEDTDNSNLLERLHTALLTAAKHKGGLDDNAPDAGAAGSSTPIEVADMGASTLSLQAQRLAAVEAYATGQHRRALESRLQQVFDSGRCTADEFKGRREQPHDIRLSLGSDGKPVLSDLEKWLDSREAVPAGTFWDPATRTKRAAAVEVAPLRMAGDTMQSQAEVDEIVHWALGRNKKK
jgi:hypothetical protein